MFGTHKTKKDANFFFFFLALYILHSLYIYFSSKNPNELPSLFLLAPFEGSQVKLSDVTAGVYLCVRVRFALFQALLGV